MKRALVLAVFAAACLNRKSLDLPPIDDPSSALLVADNAERTGIYAARANTSISVACSIK